MVGLAVFGLYAITGDSGEKPEFRLASVERGTIVKTVSASGKLNAVATAEIGSQVSGQIKELAVDFNSPVRAGQVIARIDPAAFEAKVRQARAEVAVAKATVLTRKAAVARARADLKNAAAGLAAVGAEAKKAAISLDDAKLEYNRKLELKTRGVIAVSQVDKARAAFERALAQVNVAKAHVAAQKAMMGARKAQVEMAEAEIGHARAEVQRRGAALHYSQIDLEHTFIRSPVDGVVIGRNVTVGQTVAASFQAPKLFTIAQNLRKMQVETNIDEADVGQVHTGQSAKFTVDSFPGQEFEGTVTQIRKTPQEVENVVTYTVVITAENPNLRLLPGMTANVQVVVSQRPNVLKVPNAALRFRPAGVAAPEAGRESARGGQDRRDGEKGRNGQGGRRAARDAARLAGPAEQLDLDEQQKERISELYKNLRHRRRAMRQSGTPRQEVRQAMRALRQQLSRDIMPLLNPEQREKYQRILAERAANPVRRGQIWVLENGSPKAVEVRTGVSDGSFTEVVRGDLKEGQKIIAGVKRKPAGRAATSGGDGRRGFSRLRF